MQTSSSPLWLSKVWKRAPLFLATITGVNQFLVFLPYVNFKEVAISSLRCLPNKVEKRINELPELLQSLFTDFMEIKNLHFEIFYYCIHNKAGVPISSSRAVYCRYSSSDNERKFEMVFYDCFFAQMDFMLKVHAVINLAHSEKEWSNFVQVTWKIIYSSLPCHASLLSSGCLEWDLHTLPLFNMLTRPKINYRDPVDEWRGWRENGDDCMRIRCQIRP